METVDENFKKGFNSGYLLSKHDPELLNKILKEQKNDSLYFKGLASGMKQHHREMLLDQLKESRNRSKNKGLELD